MPTYISQAVLQIRKYFTKGHERSVTAKKQILGLVIFKGLVVPIQLLLVSMSINFLDQAQYGIWLTLSAVISWINFFDIGFGNGLRNKFAEAKAKGNHDLARCYVSTAYAGIFFIITGISILFFTVNPFLNWTKILNAPSEMESELKTLVLVVYLMFSLQFIFHLINTLFLADQKPARASFFNLLVNSLTLLVLFILTKVISGKILYLGFIFSGIPVLVMLVISLWYFNGDFKKYRPSLKFIRKEYFKDLIGLGLKFFIIQIGALVLFQVSNILIAQYYGPSEVTPYNISFKYFGIITMVFSLINTPFWSAFTDAYTKKEFTWIKGVFNKLLKIWLLFALASVVLLLISPYIYKIWVPSVKISYKLSVINCVYAIVLTWNAIFFSFINGIGKIKLQFYLMFLMVLLFFLFTFIFIRYSNLNSAGIILSMTICQAIFSILIPIQFYKIINNKATGIWNA